MDNLNAQERAAAMSQAVETEKTLLGDQKALEQAIENSELTASNALLQDTTYKDVTETTSETTYDINLFDGETKLMHMVLEPDFPASLVSMKKLVSALEYYHNVVVNSALIGDVQKGLQAVRDSIAPMGMAKTVETGKELTEGERDHALQRIDERLRRVAKYQKMVVTRKQEMSKMAAAAPNGSHAPKLHQPVAGGARESPSTPQRAVVASQAASPLDSSRTSNMGSSLLTASPAAALAMANKLPTTPPVDPSVQRAAPSNKQSPSNPNKRHLALPSFKPRKITKTKRE